MVNRIHTACKLAEPDNLKGGEHGLNFKKSTLTHPPFPAAPRSRLPAPPHRLSSLRHPALLLHSGVMLAIAIDGTAGSGKSTLAMRVAHRLGYKYIDSGAMYRVVGWMALQKGIELDDPGALGALAHSLKIDIERTDESGRPRFLINGVDISEEIRSPEASQAASSIAAVSAVREAMVEQQRRLGRRGRVVMEGRDIGTVVLPDTRVKFFLTARLHIRAQRRRDELTERGNHQTLEHVMEELRKRDTRDSTRQDSPLKPAPDAVILDTSDKSLDQLEAEMLQIIAARTGITA